MKQISHTIKRALLLSALLAWTTFLLIGCVTREVNKPPLLSLANVGLESIGLFEQRLSLSLRVQNPNETTMEIRGLSCTLDINGQRFAQGVHSRPFTVAGYSDTVVTVSANASTGSVLRQVQTMAQGGRESIDYHLRGDAEVKGLGQIPFDQLGDIPLLSLLGEPSRPRRSP